MHLAAGKRAPSHLIGPGDPRVQGIEVDEGFGLFDPLHQQVLVLNETAREVWRLSDGHHTAEDLVRHLARRYRVDPATIEDEVLATLDVLDTHGLLLYDEPEG